MNPYFHVVTTKGGGGGALLCTLCLHHPHNNELHLTLAYNTYNIGKVVTRFYFPFILFWVALYNCYRAVLRGSVPSARHMTLWCTTAMHSWVYTILWQTRITLSAKIWHQRTALCRGALSRLPKTELPDSKVRCQRMIGGGEAQHPSFHRSSYMFVLYTLYFVLFHRSSFTGLPLPPWSSWVAQFWADTISSGSPLVNKLHDSDERLQRIYNKN